MCLLSTLVHPQRPIPPEIVKLTGITDQLVEDFGHPEKEAFADFRYLLGCCQYVMAHNGNLFDKLFWEETCERLGWKDADRLWLDTKVDIKFPPEITTRNLRHLASEHGFLNPFAHRAVFDVLTMFKVAGCYDIAEIIARAKEPTLYVQALVSFEEKEQAKARGYYWFGPRKLWWRTFKQSDYEAEKQTCGFQTRLMDKAPE